MGITAVDCLLCLPQLSSLHLRQNDLRINITSPDSWPFEDKRVLAPAAAYFCSVLILKGEINFCQLFPISGL